MSSYLLPAFTLELTRGDNTLSIIWTEKDPSHSPPSSECLKQFTKLSSNSKGKTTQSRLQPDLGTLITLVLLTSWSPLTNNFSLKHQLDLSFLKSKPSSFRSTADDDPSSPVTLSSTEHKSPVFTPVFNIAVFPEETFSNSTTCPTAETDTVFCDNPTAPLTFSSTKPESMVQ
ncbi:hypothetical protein AVEN_12005-1 [Araneus ventricosus]|uniref:Uncharacterized protein n=1 Tax=Araneus ventricosus TaxID=182803 RepID=A0A4Y2G460_ARAVE|nr:hypothetical protein AVEN_12005-1 [Araneus ventricosus]